MPASLASLVGQPAAPDQQSIQGGDNTAQPQSGGDGISSPGLSSLVRQQLLGSMTGGQGGGAPVGGTPGGGQPQQQGPPPPSAEETMAMWRHLTMFQAAYIKVMHDPDFGKGDIKGPVMEMMSDMVGEGLVTLPQVMDQLKQFPTQPLQQRQWVEKKFSDARQAALGILDHHVAAFPQALPWQLERPKAEAAYQTALTGHGDTMKKMNAQYSAGAGAGAQQNG